MTGTIMARTTVFAGRSSETQPDIESNGREVRADRPASSANPEAVTGLSRRRRVLIIVENQAVPLDSRVWGEARSLSGSGCDVTVLCPKRKGCSAGHEIIDGVRVYRHPMPIEARTPRGYLAEYACAFALEFLYTLWIYLRHGFDVIQGCNPPDNIFLVALPFKMLGVKYIFDHHDANPELYVSKYERQGALYKVLLRLEKLCYQHSDVVMVTNASYRNVA